ncbi:MAG: hypothetical protein ACQESA_02440 [Patescibacteria group bacterium]
MFPFSKRILTTMLFVFLVIVASVFVYVQFLFIQKEKVLFPEEGYSVEYNCSGKVKDRESAKECFNAFFMTVLKNIEEEKGSAGLSEDVRRKYEKIDKEDVSIYEEEVYYIAKDVNGKFYYIKNGVVVSE